MEVQLPVGCVIIFTIAGLPNHTVSPSILGYYIFAIACPTTTSWVQYRYLMSFLPVFPPMDYSLWLLEISWKSILKKVWNNTTMCLSRMAYSQQCWWQRLSCYGYKLVLADITPICRRASEMLSSWLPLQLPSYLFCLTDFKHQQLSCVMTSLIAKQGIVTYLSSPSMFPDTTSVLSHNGQYILCDYSVPITLHTQ